MALRSIKKIFREESDKELSKYTNAPASLITESDIASLPGPVQRYFHLCGYIGQEKAHYAQVAWETFYLKMSPDKEWMPTKCTQYNFVDEPARIVYMNSRMGGLLPFGGRDKYQHGHGSMLIKVLGFVKVADYQGPQMDSAALVTILAEALLVPSYALQPYIRWSSSAPDRACATLEYGGTKVSGNFYFNDSGECVRFDTEDRYFTEKDGSYKKTPWSAFLSNYIARNGIRFPSEIMAVWHTDSGDYPYFKGRIEAIRYDQH